MVRFCPPFSRKAFFVIAICCAVAAVLVKCRNDAIRDFAAKVTIVETALSAITPEVDQELYEAWLQEAKATNPKVREWEKIFGHLKNKDKVKIAVSGGGSGVANTTEYFGSLNHDWTIIRSTDSPKTDYSDSALPITPKQVIRVNVKITCYQPFGLFSRKTSISIDEKPASDNKRFIERLKTELDKCDTRYEIEDHQ